MNKKRYSIIITGLLFLILGTLACNLPGAQTPQISTASPTETSTPAIISSESATAVTSTPEFAPLCESGNATRASVSSLCKLPIAEAGSAFCTSKLPYNLVYINQGATYEVLTRGFRCSDAGLKAGRQLLTCTGPMAADYAVNVCDPACAIPTVQADITQCPQGFNYNYVQGCCTQEPQQVDPNCMVLKLETTRCVVDCSEFKKIKDCNANSYACEWDTASKSCRPR